MARKPNYDFERRERDKAKAAKKEDRAKAKAERKSDPAAAPQAESAPGSEDKAGEAGPV